MGGFLEDEKFKFEPGDGLKAKTICPVNNPPQCSPRTNCFGAFTELFDSAKKGEYGLKLHTEDYSQYQRYGAGVMTVNGMTPEELIRYQRLGLFKIYLMPWRWIPIIRKFSIPALMKGIVDQEGRVAVTRFEMVDRRRVLLDPRIVGEEEWHVSPVESVAQWMGIQSYGGFASATLLDGPEFPTRAPLSHLQYFPELEEVFAFGGFRSDA